MHRAVHAVLARYDRTYGGFGGAPKFPPTMTLDFLLRHRLAGPAQAALESALAELVQND